MDDIQRPASDATATQVFLAWERLRLQYNALLVLFTLLACVFIFQAGRHGRGIPAKLVAGAIVANVCFCAGPCVEGYLCLLGFNRILARYAAFVTGTGLALLLSLGALIVWAFPSALVD